MSNNFESYDEELADASDAHHHVQGGNLYLLFGVAKTTITPAHRKVIAEKVVPFITRAVTRFGPGEYQLRTLGLASASNRTNRNYQLAEARGKNAAMEAIRQFEALQKSNPALAGATVNANLKVKSDEFSSAEAQMLRLKPHQIDKVQGFHRSAVFSFKAGFKHGTGASIYEIREIYYFKMEEKAIPLPQFIREFQQQHPGISKTIEFAVGMPLEKLIGALIGRLPLQLLIAAEIVKYMVPVDLQYRVQIRDYRMTTATYNITANGHKFDYLNSLAAFMQAKAAIKALKEILQHFAKTVGLSNELARAIAAVDRVINNSGFSKYPDIPTSEWVKFKFRDGQPGWKVHKLGPIAKVSNIALGGRSITTIKFGRPELNSDWGFAAEVDIPNPKLAFSAEFGASSSTIAHMVLI